MAALGRRTPNLKGEPLLLRLWFVMPARAERLSALCLALPRPHHHHAPEHDANTWIAQVFHWWAAAVASDCMEAVVVEI